MSENWSLSKDDTLVLKGIAIIAMLCHHVYCCVPEWAEGYTGVLAFLGSVGKCCVAMFLFCSGYGLAAQYEKTLKECSGKLSVIVLSIQFVRKRLIKFYMNYWIIFLLFVPLTIWAFNRPLTEPYGEHVNLIKHLVYDLLGMQEFQSYNITWWFNKLIIYLYLMFPLIYWVGRKSVYALLLLAFILMRFVKVDYDYMPFISDYMLPFALGISWQMMQNKWSKARQWTINHSNVFIFLSLMMLFGCVVCRERVIIPHFSGIRVDGLISVAIAFCVMSMLKDKSQTRRLLVLLGKHSINIYLMHTFFNNYWPTNHYFHGKLLLGGALNMPMLLLLCLFVSVGVETLKRKVGFSRLATWITQL